MHAGRLHIASPLLLALVMACGEERGHASGIAAEPAQADAGTTLDAGVTDAAPVDDAAPGSTLDASARPTSSDAASSEDAGPARDAQADVSPADAHAPQRADATAGGPDGGRGELVAFPGAEGFGRMASGGRGGAVYHVTTLADSGPGSLRDAVSAPNRTVVFDVSGVIKLSSRLVFSSNLTIAGQSAPGGGVVVYGDGSSFTNANHTIVRYMRFRMGVRGESEKDAIAIARGHDMIFDHCSISWGRDGNFDVNQESGYELFNITLQDSIVAQGLQPHSTGGLLVADGVSVLRSLYIDNNSRNPKARQKTQWVNNIAYNWVVSGYILGDTSGRSDGYMVGSYFIPGPETNGGTLDSPSAAYHLYAAGNYYDSDKDGALGGRLLGKGDFGSVSWETAPSATFPPVRELTAQQAYDHVVAHAGASLARDQVDDFVIAELKSLGKKGATISDEASLGLPNAVGTIRAGAPPMDTDQDGMPDGWETEHGLSPSVASDRNGDRNGDGWTNLEEYLNGLVP